MKRHSRPLMRTVAAFLAWALAVPVLAHDGAHTPDMLARVETASLSGDRVEVRFTLTGLGGPLLLHGVDAEGARATLAAPLIVRFAEDVEGAATLIFDGPAPGIFTLGLDFGPDGRGGVVVIPVHKSP